MNIRFKSIIFLAILCLLGSLQILSAKEKIKNEVGGALSVIDPAPNSSLSAVVSSASATKRNGGLGFNIMFYYRVLLSKQLAVELSFFRYGFASESAQELVIQPLWVSLNYIVPIKLRLQWSIKFGLGQSFVQIKPENLTDNDATLYTIGTELSILVNPSFRIGVRVDYLYFPTPPRGPSVNTANVGDRRLVSSFQTVSAEFLNFAILFGYIF